MDPLKTKEGIVMCTGKSIILLICNIPF
jgi:hypothetical protein